MTLTIGRASGLRPHTLQRSAMQLTLEGTATASSLAAKKALRQQLLGLVGNIDEMWIPVQYTSDSTYDGYYMVEALDVQRLGVEGSTDFQWTATLRAARNRRYPLVELSTLQGVATNSHAVASAYHSLWTPEADMTYDGVGSSITTETGVVYQTRVQTSAQHSVFFTGQPSTHYNGACTIELYDGATWRSFVGRDLEADPGLTGWRLNNGRIKCTPGSDGKFTTEVYASGWEDSTIWRHTDQNYSGAEPTTGYKSFTVLRNSPEVVTVRVTAKKNSTNYGRTIDLTVRRGMPFIEVVIRWQGTASYGAWRVNTATAGTSVIAGLTATTTNAAGNKYILGSPNDIAKDTTNGIITQQTTTRNDMQCIFGYDVGAMADFTPSVSCWAGSEVQKVIGL